MLEHKSKYWLMGWNNRRITEDNNLTFVLKTKWRGNLKWLSKMQITQSSLESNRNIYMWKNMVNYLCVKQKYSAKKIAFGSHVSVGVHNGEENVIKEKKV